MNPKEFLNTSFVIAAVLLGSTAFAPFARGDSSPQHTPFVEVVLKDFDGWDTNHDGVLSAEEIDKAVMDPAVKGDDAAAVGAIKLLSHSKKNPLPPLTRPFFAEYDTLALAMLARHHQGHETVHDTAEAMNATQDSVASASTTQPTARSTKLPADFDLYFTAGKERIARGGPVPFTGRFVLEDTRQGPLGDCFFVSSISSLAFHDQARFDKLIAPRKDGGYVIKLPNAEPIIVPAPTDAELAISSTTAGDGTWLAIMEQAFGRYKARLKGHNDDIDGTDIMRVGGDSWPTIGALTGHDCTRIAFGKTVEIRKEKADEILPALRKELETAIAGHRAITAGTARSPLAKGEVGTVPPVPPSISLNHVYAILGYDPATDVVEIWNPHGQHFEPKGPAGIKNGYPTEHGRFKLPLTEAFEFYSSFTFETAAPYKAAAPN